MRTIAVATMAMMLAQGQQMPSFEVASVKPNNNGSNSSSLSGVGGASGRLTFTNVSLRECIAYAFGIASGRDQELETPNWMSDAKFNILATMPAGTPRDRVREMMQALLRERFHLQTHTEKKRVAAYVLTVAKGGPKLKRNTVRDDGSFSFGRGYIQAEAIGIAGLANRLSSRQFDVDRLVVDQTGIEGAFDFELHWAVADANETSTESSLFTSIREQLGLELKAQNIEINVVVVDRADRVPAGN